VGVGIADDEAIRLDIHLAGLRCSFGPNRWQCQLPQGPRLAQRLWLAQNPVGAGVAGDEAISNTAKPPPEKLFSLFSENPPRYPVFCSARSNEIDSY